MTFTKLLVRLCFIVKVHNYKDPYREPVSTIDCGSPTYYGPLFTGFGKGVKYFQRLSYKVEISRDTLTDTVVTRPRSNMDECFGLKINKSFACDLNQ